MPADVLEQAFHSAYSVTPEAQKVALDATGTSLQSAQSYQSNRAIIAILATTTEAIPFVHYLPADIKSNEAKLAILEHITGSESGHYKEGALLDGAHSGDRYISSARDHVLEHGEDGSLSGKITLIQESQDKCDPNGKVVKLVRGSTIIYVNGLRAGQEVQAKAAVSPIAGSVVLEGTTYTLSGTVNTDNGDIDVKVNPPLPKTVAVLAEGFIDYERQEDLTPEIITGVETFNLFANSWRVTTRQSIDSRTQMANELGLDSYSEGVIAIQAQFSNERHYDVLRKARRVAVCNRETFDFNWSKAGDFKVRADIWRDFSGVLGSVSQKMALLTMNHGVTHLYVGEKVAAQMRGLPSDIWQSSGITAKAGIYRLGRLFGMYDVYYSPRVVNENAESAEILCIGQASDVTRNPFILGDAVAPTVIPLATNSDFKSGAGYYARNFTSVNPHGHSAQGAALITVTNLF
ncbi:hypothetical protein [Acinetobacter proteolyticus]|uniref:Uncharacterized protein n=1 Tax=Acinetobacter proteolyticus TaxID=1776741 RepID=A0A2N0WIH4_9GAMM|nr:hypothetical protein [Acinetobacter proteolyticus]PKF35566.1 hypothetical protein CW311_04565 [Acinetobacter proteolyticus]